MEAKSISWSNYQYGDYHREAVKEHYKYCQPSTGAPSAPGMAFNTSLLFASIAKDFFVGSAIDFARSLGYCLPAISSPDLPRPQDNAEFLCFAENRALHLWSAAEKKVIEEGLEDGLCDEYEIYGVLGEWAIASYYENAADENFYLPTFLESSSPLPSNRKVTILSTEERFRALSEGDKKSILKALYTQKPPVSWKGNPLGKAAKEVYTDIRALASLLHQGNQAFITSTNDYFAKRSNYLKTAVPLTSPAPLPSAPPKPSAPPASLVFNTLTDDVAALRSFIQNLTDSSLRSRIRAAVGRDHAQPAAVRSPGELDFSTLENAPLHAISRLFVLVKSENNFYRQGYPQSFPWGETLRNHEMVRQAMSRVESLNSSDRKKLIEAVLDPAKFASLNEYLQNRFFEVSEIAEKCLSCQRFREMYRAYRTSLYAPS